MNDRGVRIKSVVSGLLIIAAGVLLLLFNSGVLPWEYKSIVFSWQMLLVALGLVFLFNRQWGVGPLLILIGSFLVLKKMNIESLAFVTQNGWTILLIIMGVVIFLKAILGHNFFCNRSGCQQKKNEDFNLEYSKKRDKYRKETGYIDLNYVFSGTKEKLQAGVFKGGDINCVFGGIELDLSDCELAEGITTLEVNSVFGGTVIYVPEDWNVEIHQSQVFGSFVDNHSKNNPEMNKNKTLIIEASSVFGGGEIRHK